MTEPLVSVAMITFNHVSYIAQAIEGVLQQKTNFPFELVIGEDCSTDGTRQIVFDYQKKYPHIIRVITSDNNVGMKQNGVRTMKACQGKYVAFCEGDDYWHHPDKLQKQVDYMESHSGCGMVFTDINIYLDRSNELIRSLNYYRGFRSPVNISIEQIIGVEGPSKMTCTVLIRRYLYEQVIERDPYLHQSEKFLMGDYQIWSEIAIISEVTYLPECLATYRVLDESASRTENPIRSFRFWKSAAEMMLYLCDKYNLSESLRSKVESAWQDRALRLAFYERNADLANEVRKNKKRFTAKDWLRYYGAKCLIVHSIYRATAFFLHLFSNKTEGHYREFGDAPREQCRLTIDNNNDGDTGAGRRP
jgi:glycosyltransferase involved in cell wall biosynthesis